MGNDPLCLLIARAAVKNNHAVSATIVKAMLNHIDNLERALNSIEDDRDER